MRMKRSPERRGQARIRFPAMEERSYVGGLERQEENPTMDLLDRLAETLAILLAELFREPRKGTSPPKPPSEGCRVQRRARFSLSPSKLENR